MAFVRSMMVAAVLALTGLPATVVHAQAPAPKVSESNSKILKAGQDALTAKRYAEAIAKAQEALANPKKTADDTYVAHYFMFEAHKAQSNKAGMMAALQGQVDSGFLPPAQQNVLNRALMSLAFEQRNFQQTIEYGQKLIKGGGADGDVYQLAGQAYYRLNNYGEAVKFFNGLVTDAEKAGRKPERNQLILLQSSYDKSGNKEAAQATLEKLVRFYPTPDTWLALLYEIKRERLDPRQKLSLFRLMDSTGNLKESPDLMAYSEAATALGLPAESYKVLEVGLKAGAFKQETEKSRADRYLASSKTRAETDKADLAKLEAEAKSAATGDSYVALGMTQYSFGDYAKAIDAMKAGIAKGGLKNMADAGLTLGIAQYKAGQKSEALQTFKSIKADDQLTQRIVKLWVLHAS